MKTKFYIFLISLLLVRVANTYASDSTLVLNKLEIFSDSTNLGFLLKEVADNQLEKYSHIDSLVYLLDISKTHDKNREIMNYHESVYLVGVKDELPWDNHLLGFVEVNGVFFIISIGGLEEKYYMNIFSKTNCYASFKLSGSGNRDYLIGDDSIVRLECRFLYKDNNFVIDKGCECYDEDGDLDLLCK